MNKSTLAIPATLMRGGSSKGLFFLGQDLPADESLRELIFLAATGSPDPYASHIDGLGGATSSTSKVVVLTPSARPDCDVDYFFGHVSIEQPVVDYSGNCGNLSSAAGVFAIESGLVAVTGECTVVKLWQMNTRQRMIVHVPTDQDGVISSGDYRVSGVPGSGAPIRVEFVQQRQPERESVLPTARVVQQLQVPGIGGVSVSLVNAGNPTVFVAPEILGLRGTEWPDQVNRNRQVLDRAEQIRCTAAVAMGASESLQEAASRPGTPKLACVLPPTEFQTTGGSRLSFGDMDIWARIFSMGQMHHAFTGTGAIAAAVAAAIPGTVVADCLDSQMSGKASVKIAHAAGLMDAECMLEDAKGSWYLLSAAITRTARTLMRGEIFIPQERLRRGDV